MDELRADSLAVRRPVRHHRRREQADLIGGLNGCLLMKRFVITLPGLVCAAPALAGSLHQLDRAGRRLEVQGHALVRSFARCWCSARRSCRRARHLPCGDWRHPALSTGRPGGSSGRARCSRPRPQPPGCRGHGDRVVDPAGPAYLGRLLFRRSPKW